LLGAPNISSEEQFAVEAEELEPWDLVREDPETGEHRLAKELLPKILITDPVVQVIKEAAEAQDVAALAATSLWRRVGLLTVFSRWYGSRPLPASPSPIASLWRGAEPEGASCRRLSKPTSASAVS
ncbi:MAG: hypothetical protein ACPIFP_01220, partial [Candidatus Poseidoniaceae archaeon]